MNIKKQPFLKIRPFYTLTYTSRMLPVGNLKQSGKLVWIARTFTKQSCVNHLAYVADIWLVNSSELPRVKQYQYTHMSTNNNTRMLTTKATPR